MDRLKGDASVAPRSLSRPCQALLETLQKRFDAVASPGRNFEPPRASVGPLLEVEPPDMHVTAEHSCGTDDFTSFHGRIKGKPIQERVLP
jgi:hypothetical protein